MERKIGPRNCMLFTGRGTGNKSVKCKKKARAFARAPNYFNSETILTHALVKFQNRARIYFFYAYQ